MNENCAECHYSRISVDTGELQCRRRSPIHAEDVVDFPVTYFTNWCGEFKWKESSDVTLWLVGRHHGPGEKHSWSVLGIFDSKERAVKECTHVGHFVGPVTVGTRLPDEPIAWPDAFYPLADIP